MSSDFDRHEPGFHVLHRVSDTVHTYVTEFLFQGKAPIHNRSVIVQVPAATGPGSLVVINPAELRPEVEAGLRRLEEQTGARITHLISPGDWHHLFIGQHLRAFPGAVAYVPPGRIPAMQPDLAHRLIDVSGADPFPELAPHVAVHVVQGLRDFTEPSKPRYELVFHLPAIGAITSGDVLYYIGKPELHPVQKAIGQRAGVVDFHFHKWVMVANPTALQRSLDHVLGWTFDRYVSIHGDPGNMRESGARADVEAVRAWAGAPPADHR